MECKDLRKRLDKLCSDRKVVEEQWTLIRQYVVPYRGQFFKDVTSEGGVEWRENRKVFDSTAPNANNVLSSSLHGAITNPSHQWFTFRFRDEKLSDDKEAAQWLRDCATVTFETIRDSNFNLQANEGYIDLTSFGTAFIVKELEEENGDLKNILFKCSPLEECYFEQDHRGDIIYFYKKMKWSAVMVHTKFGDQTPDDIKQKAENQAGSDMDINVTFAVYPREDKKDASGILTPENRPFGYKYFLHDDAKQLGDEGGYYSMPALVMRWRSTADSMWGNSPAMIALPDILTLNQLVELILDSLEKVVDPAVKVTERGLLSDLDLGPAGLNVVRSMDDMEAFESRARFDVAELNREKLQMSINQTFYVDQLEMKESPAMTATEVNVRYELMQRLLGPTLGRLESDFLDPLVTSVFADLLRYKRLPEPPSSIDAFDPTFNVEYTGPMARAQKQDDANRLIGFLGAVAQLGEVQPKALDKVNWDMSVDLLAEYHGAEPKVLKSEKEMKRLRRDQEQNEQDMAEGQIAEQVGKGQAALQEGGPPPLTAV